MSHRHPHALTGFAGALLALALAACGGGDSATATQKKMHGAVMKGPVQGATIQFFLIDETTGVLSPTPLTVSSVTETNGNVTVTGLPTGVLIFARSTGGFYFDESDSNTANPRKITLTGALYTLLPANTSTFAITPYSMAMYMKALNQYQSQSTYTFGSIYSATRFEFTQVFGFDPVTTIPADPFAPGSGGSATYAALLGGASQAINAMAVNLGHIPGEADVTSFIADISDGHLDGVCPPGVSQTPCTDLNAEIRRFRSNNPQNYGSVPTITLDETALTQPAVVTNQQPTINTLSDLAFVQNSSPGLQTVNLSGISAGSGETQTLTVTVTSSNPAIVPTPSVTYTTPNTTGSIDFTPVTTAAGSSLITVTVKDNGGTANGGSDTTAATFTVTINATNTPPSITSTLPASATEDTLYTYSAVVTDPDGPSATWALGAGDTCGGSIVPSTGVYTFTPVGPVPAASCVVDIQVSDGSSIGTQSGTVTITAVNDAPAISSTAPTPATEGALYTYNATVNDPDGPSATWSLTASDTCGGSIGGSTGTYTFTPTGPTPPPNCVVGIQVSDGSLSATQNTTIAITAVNNPPTINSTIPTTATEDTLYTYNATVNDPDGPSATWSVGGSDTCGGSIVPSTGVYTFTPVGPVPAPSCVVAVQVTDGGAPVSQSATVTITAVNDAPAISSTAPTPATEDVLYTYNATVNDPDGPSATWSLTGSDTCGGSIVPSTGVYTFTPAGPTPPASCVVGIQVNDGSLNGTQNTTISITAVNDAPTINSTIPATATEDTLYTYNATVNDPDGPSATWSVGGSDTCGGSIVPSTGVYTFTPVGPVPAPSCVVAVQVTDGGAPVSQSATVTITAVNDAPAISSTAPTPATEDVLYTYNATVNDPDGPSATWSLTGSDTCGGSIVPSTGVYTFTPAGPVPPASCVVGIQVSDGSLNGTQNTTISITAVNDPPVINSTIPATATEDTLYTYNATVNDPDGPSATWSVGGSDTCGGSIVPSTGVYTFTPVGPVPAPSCVVAVQVTDGGAPVSQSATVTITAVNDPPVAVDDTGNTNEDVDFVVSDTTLLANDSDPDGPGMSVTAVSNATNGVVNLVSGTVTFTPTSNFSGTAGFDYTVSDGSLTDIGHVTVTVASVNDAPVGTPTTVSTNEDVSYVFTTLDFGFTDPNDSPANNFVNVTIATLPTNGVLALNSIPVSPGQSVSTVAIGLGQLTFLPAANASGVPYDTFTFQVQDDGGGTPPNVDTDTLARLMTIDVMPVNDPPVFVGDPYTFAVDENSPNGTAVGTVNAGDADLDTVSYAIVSGDPGGAFAIDTSGNITVADTAQLDFETTPTFTLQVDATDGNGGTDSAAVTINLNNLAEPVGALFPYLAGDGKLYLFDPLTPGSPQLIDTMPPVTVDEQLRTTFTADSFTSGVANNIRPARLFYIKDQGGGVHTVWKLDLERGHSHVPVQISSITDACRFNHSADDFTNPDQSLLRIDTAGADTLCGPSGGGGAAADDAAFMISASEPTGSTGTAIGMGDCCGNYGVHDAAGHLTAVLTTEGGGGSTVLLNRRSVTAGVPGSPSNVATFAAINGSMSTVETGMGDHIYFRAKLQADTSVTLLRYDDAGSTLTKLYDYGVPDGTSFNDNIDDDGGFDANNLYFVDGAKVFAIPHTATGLGQETLLDTAPASITRVAQTANRIVYEAHGASSGGVFSALKDNSGAPHAVVPDDTVNGVIASLATVDRTDAYVNIVAGGGSTLTARVVDPGNLSSADTADTQWIGSTFGSSCDFNVGCDHPNASAAILRRTSASSTGATLDVWDPVGLAPTGVTLGTIPGVAPGSGVFGFGFGNFAMLTRADMSNDSDIYFADVTVDNTGFSPLQVSAVPAADDVWLLGNGGGGGGGGNQSPSAIADSLTVAQGGSTSQLDALVGGGPVHQTSVLWNDTDPENDPLTVGFITSGVTPPVQVGPLATIATPHGSVTVHGDGTFTYTHDGSASFFDSFQYTANDGHSDGPYAAVNITINPGSPPANDNFGNASLINLDQTDTVNNGAATLEGGEPTPTCASIGGSVWYSFTPASATTVTIDTLGSSFDTVLGVYTGPGLGSLTEVTCNDDEPSGLLGTHSLLTFAATGGTTYWIQAGGFGSAVGVLTVNVRTDTDGDGVGDVTELARGTNPNSADSDGDGFSDFVELAQDGDPTTYNPGSGDSNPTNAFDTPNNDPPVAMNDSYSVAQGGTLTVSTTINGVLGNDYDPEGTAITTSQPTGVDLPTHGTLALNGDGTFTYTHDNSATPSDAFTYTVCDSSLPTPLCSTATATITVGVNAAPSFSSSPTTPYSLSMLSASGIGPYAFADSDDPSGANTYQVTLTLSGSLDTVDAQHGALHVNDTISGGVTPGEILMNGSAIVTINATLSEINTTLQSFSVTTSDFDGLTYLPAAFPFSGVQELAVTVDDLQASGQTTQSVPLDVSRMELADGASGTVTAFDGEATGDILGVRVAASGGDFNGDGIPDIVMASAGFDPSGNGSAANTGRVYVMFGGTSATNFQELGAPPGLDPVHLGTDIDGTNGFVVQGEAFNDRLGTNIALGGDLDHDGYADLVIGAQRWRRAVGDRPGRIYVIFGGQALPAFVDLASPPAGLRMLTITGINNGDNLGRAEYVGDINRDGYPDLVVGAPGASPLGRTNAGTLYAIFGGPVNPSIQACSGICTFDVSTLNGGNGFAIYGATGRPQDINNNFLGDQIGYIITGTGDFNGDHVDDFTFGSSLADSSGGTNSGQAYVIFGHSGGFPSVIDLASLGSAGAIFNGNGAGDPVSGGFGQVAAAGDIDGDGLGDLLVGKPDGGPLGRSNAGKVFVVYGSPSYSATPQTDLGSVGTSVAGFQIAGAAANDFIGGRVRRAGDVNHDGIDDFAFMAGGRSPGGRTLAGSTYLVYGSPARYNGLIDLAANTDGRFAFVINGAGAGDMQDGGLGTLGDLNGDGSDDFAVGADQFDTTNQVSFGPGIVYAIFGEDFRRAVDSDGDGLSDAYELALGTNPGNPDTDGDGLSDGLEVRVLHTNPKSIDSDGDGLSDYAEVTRSGSPAGSYDPGVDTDPNNADTDGDGIPDNTDPDPLHGNVAPVFNMSAPDGYAVGMLSPSGIGPYQFTDANDPSAANTYTVTLTLSGSVDTVDALQGALHVNDTVPGGVNSGEITGNDTAVVQITASLTEINTTLQSYNATISDFDGLQFQPPAQPFSGVQRLDVTIDDLVGGQTPQGIDVHVSRINLADVGSEYVTRLDGETADDRTGLRVAASSGDFNGDGIPDLVTDASQQGAPTGNHRGKVFVLYGGNGSDNFHVLGGGGSIDPFHLGSDFDGSNGFVVLGAHDGDTLGTNVTLAGDLDRDGYADLVIGAQRGFDFGMNARPGKVYVIFGGQSIPGGVLDLANPPSNVRMLTFTGLAPDDFLGRAEYIGDINHDGYVDLALAAPTADPGAREDAGQVYVIFGASASTLTSSCSGPCTFDLATLNGSNGFTINGITGRPYDNANNSATGDQVGYILTPVGDFNGDHVDDFMFGSATADAGAGRNNAGQAYVLFGHAAPVAFNATIELGSMTAADGVTFNGETAGDPDAGGLTQVSGAGDVDGDGLGDLVIGYGNGSPGGRANAGMAYVVYGSATSGSVVDLADVGTTVPGYRLEGAVAGDLVAGRVRRAGDIDRDGIDDFMISASGRSPGGKNLAGSVYVIFGSPARRSGSINLASLDGRYGFSLDGANAGDIADNGLGTIGDLNNDGYDDLAVAAVQPNNGGPGLVYTVFGAGFRRTVDSDSDGLSDAYESVLGTNYLVAPADQDTDGDGLDDRTEVRVTHTNPLVADSDSDGLTDAQEVAAGPHSQGYDPGYDTDPNNSDTDGDGLLDGADPNPLFAPSAADTDGDGVSNNIESFGLGGDPSNPNKVLFVSGLYGNDSNDGHDWGHALQTNAAVVAALDTFYSGGYPTDPLNTAFVLYDRTSALGQPGSLVLNGAMARQHVAFIGGLGPGVDQPDNTRTRFQPNSGGVVQISNATGITLGALEIANGNSGIGSGLYVHDVDGAAGVTLVGSDVHGNFATLDGGGIAVSGTGAGAVLVIQDSDIYANNVNDSVGSNGRGAGVFIDGSFASLTMKKSKVRTNDLLAGGGASVEHGGGLDARGGASVTIDDSVFADNITTAGPGGGVNLYETGAVSIRNSRFLSNESLRPGGGLHVHPAGPTLIFNNLFVGNVTTDLSSVSDGGAVEIDVDNDGGDGINFNDNTVAYNQVLNWANAAGGVSVKGNPPASSPLANINNNIIWFNQDSSPGTSDTNDNFLLNTSNSFVASGSGNNIDENPPELGPIASGIGSPSDPLFTLGFYLDQITPSLSIDGGNGAFASVYAGNNAQFNSTDIGYNPDAGAVDIGYHYKEGASGNLIGVSASPTTLGGCSTTLVMTPNFQFGNSDQSGHRIGVKLSGVAGSSVISRSTLDPMANGTVLARDLGNGNYSVDVSGSGTGTGTITVYADNQATPVTFQVQLVGGGC